MDPVQKPPGNFATLHVYVIIEPLKMKFWKKHGGLGSDRTIVGHPYGCKDTKAFESTIAKLTESSIHPYSPNVDFEIDAEAEMYWLQMADFYHWPHVQYFDALNDLKYKLQSTNFSVGHRRMKQEMRIKKNILKTGLCNMVEKLHKKIYQ